MKKAIASILVLAVSFAPIILNAQFRSGKVPVKQSEQPVKTLQTKQTTVVGGQSGSTQQTSVFSPTAEQLRSYNWYQRINPTNIVVPLNPANAAALSDPSLQAYVSRKEMNLTGWINQNLDLGVAASCDSLVHLRSLGNLEYVRLRSYPSDACFPHLAGLKNLRYLEYAGASSQPENLMVTDASMHIVGTLTSLEVLRLFSCNRVTDAGLSRLSGLVNMKELDLNHWTGLGPDCLQYLANMKKLETLRIVGLTLNDHALLSLAQLPQLNFLNATRVSGLTDQAADNLIAILPQLPNLKRINLQFTGVSEAAKQRIRDRFPGISVW